MTDPSDNQSFFSGLNSHYDALRMVKDTSNAFFLIAALQVVTMLLTGALLGGVDVAVNGIGGWVLRRQRSRAAAVVLLVFAVLTFVVVVLPWVGVNVPHQGGAASFIFALVGLWAGVRATEATFKLHGSLAQDAPKAAGSGTD